MQLNIHEILKKAYERAKRQESIAKNMSISFFILQQIVAHPGITSAKLACLLKRNETAVKRYIEELRTAGQNIQYDDVAKG